MMHAEIKDAVVINNEDEYGNKYLCAYVVPLSPGSPDFTGLKEYLSGRLPGYMIPSYFNELERIPLNANGKVDMKALPLPGLKPGAAYAPPRNPVEKKLAKIWSGVLNIIDKSHPSPGIDDNFFELGGHSLKATILVSEIHKEFNTKIPLGEIFRTPTIRGLSQYIRQAAADIYTSIEVAEKKEYYALSSAQKRLYVLQQIGADNIGYNESSVLELEGEPDRRSFEKTFRKLIKRHESLRTSFTLIEDDPVQRIHDEVKFFF